MIITIIAIVDHGRPRLKTKDGRIFQKMEGYSI